MWYLMQAVKNLKYTECEINADFEVDPIMEKDAV